MKESRQCDAPWSEDEYLAYLAHERYLFAWCMEHVGSRAAKEAREAAAVFYYYEAPDVPHRELTFHDEAWHWAMIRIAGDGYWQSHAALAKPSAEYRAESEKYDARART